MVTVPAEIPVTTPDALTVATVASEVTHAFATAGVPVVDKPAVEPTHTVAGPVRVGDCRISTFTDLIDVQPPADSA